MNNGVLSPTDIQSHIYTAFLQRKTADVALRIIGTWRAVYKLHRLVLIQSGFFQSLFTAGFLESSPSSQRSKYGCDVVDIVFPDRNITRAAFEVCIARLYGGGPPLHKPSSLIPTAAYPLTPSFPVPQEPEPTPLDHHPATPRFLLSLLATSIYLSIPSVATQALSLILSTVGPTTALPYLNFALGKPLSHPSSSSGQPEAAVGLESVALPLEEEEEVTFNPSAETYRSNEAEEFSDILSGLAIKDDAYRLSPATSSDESISSTESNQDDDIICHYGAVSNKIGEASSCWLARWAVDIFNYETSQRQAVPSLSRKRPTVGGSADDNSQAQSSPPDRLDVTIWGCGGLSAKWVAALVSSDCLFVKNERYRYDFARSVVELRRAGGVLPEEEQEWSKMFETGIYYSNMSMEDIIAVSNDISPTTKLPFVPLRVLQGAHWSQSVFRHKVTSLPPSICSPIPSATPKDKELGITVMTPEILSQISRVDLPESSNHEAQKAYFPVPSDSSLRIGDNGTAFSGTQDGSPVSMDELFKFTDSPSVAASHSSNGRTVHKQNSTQVSPLSTSESTFFGLLSSRRTGSECVSLDGSGKARWSPYPPCRFSVEFWDYEALKEKNRLYSNTVWYAGSLFNVYIQIIRKKGQGQTQLGVYVHRQSSIDPIPHPSAFVRPASPVDSRESNVRDPPTAVVRAGDRHYRRVSGGSPGTPLHYSPSIHPLAHAASATFSPTSARPSSPVFSGSGSPSSPNGLFGSFSGSPTTRAPSQPYRDPRAMIAAYFMVNCASATGSSQTRFSSAPDVFSIGQSWGWKSSSLRSEEYVDIGTDDDNEGAPLAPTVKEPRPHREISFRATVVLGLV